MLSAHEITDLHDQLVEAWHMALDAQDDPQSNWLRLVAYQHRANFDLWHTEDEARAPGATDAQLADIKHRVDATNQRRNDLAEELDRTLLLWLGKHSLPDEAAPLHSESPGLMIDRLSILTLKIWHMREEAERDGISESLRQHNRERLAVLREQRNDLTHCLDNLWEETLTGKRRFKIYRQMKMYNDPLLNPAIYGKQYN